MALGLQPVKPIARYPVKRTAVLELLRRGVCVEGYLAPAPWYVKLGLF